MSATLRVAEDITELMGNTPMLRLRRVARPEWAAVYAKLEFLNPGGSVKDRAALGMILDAERQRKLKPGSTIVEATAGNTGVGLALVGVNRGYRVTLFVPEGYAEEKCILMRGFGATVVRTPEEEGMSGAIRRALAMAEADPMFLPRCSSRIRPIRNFTTIPRRWRSGSRWRGVWTRLLPEWARAELLLELRGS